MDLRAVFWMGQKGLRLFGKAAWAAGALLCPGDLWCGATEPRELWCPWRGAAMLLGIIRLFGDTLW